MTGLLIAGLALAAMGGDARAQDDRAGVAAGLDDFGEGRFAEALQVWQAAAAAGNPTAALYLGVMYDSGQGVPQSAAAALDWYRRAGEGGSAAGLFNTGVMYDSGRGVAADHGEAARWYGRAAEKGFPRAEYNLALMYEDGSGVPADRRRAIELYRAAAGHGLSAARQHLDRLGQRFAGSARPPLGLATPGLVPPDLAMLDFEKAQRVLLAHGPSEAGQAAELFRRGAEQRNALAEYDYGYCLENGFGVPRNPMMAYVWYRRAVADAADPGLQAIARAAVGASETKLSRSQIDIVRRQFATSP